VIQSFRQRFDKTSSSSRVDSLLKYLAEGEISKPASDESQAKVWYTVRSMITPASVNAEIGIWFTTSELVLALQAPEGDWLSAHFGDAQHHAEVLRGLYDSALASSDLLPMEEEAAGDGALFPASIVAAAGTADEVLTGQRANESSWQLSNGMLVKIVKQETVLLSMEPDAEMDMGATVWLQANWGLSRIHQEDEALVPPARLSMMIAMLHGLAGFTSRQLEHFMLESLVILKELDIKRHSHHARFNTSPTNLPLLFELIHHLFTQPVAIPTAEEWESIKEDLKLAFTGNGDAGSDRSMAAQLNALLFVHPMERATTADDIDNCDYAAAVSIFNDWLFTDPSDFTLTIVCEQMEAAELQAVVISLERCLASIPKRAAGTAKAKPPTSTGVQRTSSTGVQRTTSVTLETQSAASAFPEGVSHRLFFHGSFAGATLMMMWPSPAFLSLFPPLRQAPPTMQHARDEILSARAAFQAECLQKIVTAKLTERVRGTKGLVYGIAVNRMPFHESETIWYAAIGFGPPSPT
jgi:hypothetical protein